MAGYDDFHVEVKDLTIRIDADSARVTFRREDTIDGNTLPLSGLKEVLLEKQANGRLGVSVISRPGSRPSAATRPLIERHEEAERDRAEHERLAPQKAEEEKAQAERDRLERENLAKQQLPEFPWPPPPPSATAQIRCKQLRLKTSVTRFGEVDGRLSEALDANGYFERSYYAVPDGFALVTRIEQINDDGTPRGGSQRWSLEAPSLKEFSFSAYLRAVFLAPPGYYRVIVFFVTPHTIVPSQSPVRQPDIDTWSRGGGNEVPPPMAGEVFSREGDPCTITIYIYEFKRRTESDHPVFLNPGRISGHTHLVAAGLCTKLNR